MPSTVRAMSGITMAALYFAVAGRFSAGEMLIAVVTIGVNRLIAHALPPPVLAHKPPRDTVPTPGRLFRDSVKLAASAWRARSYAGEFRHVVIADPFARSTATLTLSLAPNAYVIENDKDGLLVHCLTDKGR